MKRKEILKCKETTWPSDVTWPNSWLAILFIESIYHSSYLKHPVLPPFRTPRWDERSLLLTVNHAPINLLLTFNYTNHWHQHGRVTANSSHGPLQDHPQLFGQFIWQPLNLDKYGKGSCELSAGNVRSNTDITDQKMDMAQEINISAFIWKLYQRHYFLSSVCHVWRKWADNINVSQSV